MNSTSETLEILGAAIGHCASKAGCEYAPDEIYKKLNKLQAYWTETLHFVGESRALAAVPQLAEFSKHLAKAVCALLQRDKRFLLFGGDHSCAIGTWSGVASCYSDFGLIWIDAHLDAHTPQTSPSGNLHGMPIAVLLGYGDQRLTQLFSSKLKPENLVLLGVRSYEQGELALLKSLGVDIVMMDEIRERTFEQCFAESLAKFQDRNIPYGISLDLDALDTPHISGLGTPELDGIHLEQMCSALSQVGADLRTKANPQVSGLIGVEIAEYNPKLSSDLAQDFAAIEQIVRTLVPNL